jgi:hypothetical protein
VTSPSVDVLKGKPCETTEWSISAGHHRISPVKSSDLSTGFETRCRSFETMARPTTVALTEDERKRFDNVGLDDINAMTDFEQLHKLARYMECVFSSRASLRLRVERDDGRPRKTPFR